MGSKEEVKQKKGAKCVVPLEQMGSGEVSIFSESLNPLKAYHGAGTMPPPCYAPKVACFPNMYPWIWRDQYQAMQPYGPMLQHPAMYIYSTDHTHPDLTVSPLQRQDMGLLLPGEEENLPSKKDLDIPKNCKETSSSRKGDAWALQRINVNSALDSDVATNCKETSSNDNGEASADQRNNVDSALESIDVRGSQNSLDERLGADKGSSATKRQGFNQMNAEGVPQIEQFTIRLHSKNADINSQDLEDGKARTGLKLGMKPNASSAEAKLAEFSPEISAASLPLDQQQLKKERRKRLNREAAQRSKLRKQQECQRLQEQWKVLRAESSRLHHELTSLSEECGKLQAENKSIMEELMQKYGPEALFELVDTEGDGGNKSGSREQIPSCPNNSTKDNSSSSPSEQSLSF